MSNTEREANKEGESAASVDVDDTTDFYVTPPEEVEDDTAPDQNAAD